MQGHWVIKDIDTDEVITINDEWKTRTDVEDFLDGMKGQHNIISDYWMIGNRKVYVDYEWR